jgi:tRNA pseudouridine38-40 synthase
MAMLLRLAYDGTEFHGFARQPSQRGVRTVQGELERALARLYKQELPTRGASRTDAGVHARGQLVAFDPPFEIPPRGLLLGLAAALPRDLVAHAAWHVDDPEGEPLNPRFHNLGKLYRYRIRTTALRDPLSERFEWHLPRPLELERMREAAPRLVGEHDFAGFRAADCQARTTVRRLRSIELRIRTLAELDPLAFETGRIDEPEAPAVVEIDVRGDAFLKNMVRILAGTLVAIGRGQFGTERIDELLREGDRTRAGQTAPARGLCLVEVLWPRALGGRHEGPA